MTFTVRLGNERIKIHALTTAPEYIKVNAHSLYKLLHKDRKGETPYLFALSMVGTNYVENPQLKGVLEEYEEVFQEPMGLPPTRGVEHQIILKPNTAPKHQYPYKSSHAHKDTIEKIVKEMLQVGIIQYSRSPFASPVILVKKKDQT